MNLSVGYPDPYVKVTVGHQTKTTKVQPKTLHPKWNETLKFSIATLEQLDKILINVRDKDHFYDERLGYDVTLTVKTVDCD